MNAIAILPAAGEILLERLLAEGVEVSHDCGGNLACTSCQVVVRDGMEHLSPMGDDELDLLERAAAEAPGARLACQAVSDGGEVVIEIPQAALPAPAAGTSPISVSERAARHLSVQLEKLPGAVAVRLAVEPSGCSGLRYRIDPVDVVHGDDAVFDAAGVRIVVAPSSVPFVQGTAVDLVQEGLARRLRFDNPNARHSCGCGESFGT